MLSRTFLAEQPHVPGYVPSPPAISSAIISEGVERIEHLNRTTVILTTEMSGYLVYLVLHAPSLLLCHLIPAALVPTLDYPQGEESARMVAEIHGCMENGIDLFLDCELDHMLAAPLPREDVPVNNSSSIFSHKPSHTVSATV